MRRQYSRFYPGESDGSLLYGITTKSPEEDGGAISTRVPRGPFSTSRVCLSSLALILLAGCATHDTKTADSPPPTGVEEYRQLTSQSSAGVHSALAWLEQINAQSGQCPAKIVAGFAQEIDQLQVHSMRIRARAQAIRARGDEYFATWPESGKPTPDALVPVSAEISPSPEKFRELRDRFTKIKSSSQQAGEAFRPFFAGLRKLRAGLEADPASIESPETKELIRGTREYGWQVLQKLGVLRDELQALHPVMYRAKTATGM